MKLYDYCAKGETRPKPKQITNNKIKEIGADFFLGGRLFFDEGSIKTTTKALSEDRARKDEMMDRCHLAFVAWDLQTVIDRLDLPVLV